MNNSNQTSPPQGPISQTVNLKPLPLKREEKLKIFALLSFRSDVPRDILNDQKLSLSLSVAYNAADASAAARQALTDMNLNPNNYQIPVMMINVDVDRCIQSDAKVTALSNPMSEIKIPGKPKQKTKKSTDEIATYILYAFDKVGTEAEKKIAKKVIKKFQTHAVKNKQPN